MKTLTILSNAMKKPIASVVTPARLAILLALSVGTLAGVANADQTDSRTRQVSLADLNLSSLEGQQAAQARLRAAAHLMCTQLVDELDLAHHAHYLQCVDSAMAGANQRLQAKLSEQSATRIARVDGK